MTSNARRGAYYKGKSRRLLERLGYEVGNLEEVRMVGRGERLVPVKRDQFGADLLAMSHNDILFVQVKSARKGGRVDLARARRAFAGHVFAQGTRRCIHVWRYRRREVEVISCP